MHEHVWKRFVLRYKRYDVGLTGKVWHTGYRCRCGEYGYEVPA